MWKLFCIPEMQQITTERAQFRGHPDPNSFCAVLVVSWTLVAFVTTECLAFLASVSAERVTSLCEGRPKTFFRDVFQYKRIIADANKYVLLKSKCANSMPTMFRILPTVRSMLLSMDLCHMKQFICKVTAETGSQRRALMCSSNF